jgi:hypothetical protein
MGARAVLYGHAWLYLHLCPMYVHAKVRRATSGRRTPRRAADGRTPRRAADRRALCHGWRGDMEGAPTHVRACAMGGGGIWREPQRGGREDASATYNTVRSDGSRLLPFESASVLPTYHNHNSKTNPSCCQELSLSVSALLPQPQRGPLVFGLWGPNCIL